MYEQYLQPFGPREPVSRRHALKVFAASGGAVLAGPLARTLAKAPWGDPRDALPLASGSTPLSIGQAAPYEKLIRQHHPTLALDPAGTKIWTTWTRTTPDDQGIWLRSFAIVEPSWGAMQPVCHHLENEVASTSDLAFVGGRLLVAWSTCAPEGWRIRARSFDPDANAWGAVQQIAQSPVAIKPVLAANGEHALLVWQGLKENGSFGIFGALLDAEGASEAALAFEAKDPRDCCRPAVAAAPDGSEFAVAFDRQDGPGTQNVYVSRVSASPAAFGQPLAATHHPATDICPDIAYSPDGRYLWTAWQTNRKGKDGWDIPRWYRLRALRLADGTWQQPAGGDKVGNLDKRGTDQSFEFPRLAVSPSGVVCVLGRPSHNFCLQYYDQAGASPVYRLPKDGWGGRGQFLRGVFDLRGSLWVTRRDLRQNVLHRIDGFAARSGPSKLHYAVGTSVPSFTSIRITATGTTTRQTWVPVKLAGLTARYTWPESPLDQGLNLYFGDIHGHSWQSDGMGEPSESFLRARDVFRDDFHALTDHDRFVGKRVSDGQWQQQKDLVTHYHAPGAFVTLYAQEWTTPRTNRPHGWGHYNIYSADPSLPQFDHGDPQYRDLPDLLEAVKRYNAIAIPHHIGWTGVRWDVWDPAVIAAVEICSVHGAFEYEGNLPIRHRGGTKGCFIRDGLAVGRRFAIVGGSDQHGLIWHHGVCWKRNAYRAGLTGVWAKELTRAGLLDAIRARRTFATTGVKLCLRFGVDEALMGGEVQTTAAPTMQVDVAVPPGEGQLAWLEIVRNGQVVHCYGGEGQRSRFTFTDGACPAGVTSHYYLRVTLKDNNMAWTSPVWVTRT